LPSATRQVSDAQPVTRMYGMRNRDVASLNRPPTPRRSIGNPYAGHVVAETREPD